MDIAAEKTKQARELAKKHYEIEPGLVRVLRFSGSPTAEALPNEPIKLLEVNSATVSSGVMPLHFGPVPSSGIHYPSIIIEVTPEEFQRIQSQDLKLPPGWQTSDELPKLDF